MFLTFGRPDIARYRHRFDMLNASGNSRTSSGDDCEPE